MVVPVLVEPLWACRELHCQHLKGKLSLQNWQISCSHNCRWTGAQLDARKIFGSPPCLWIIQSQLQRKPYERQQENRDVGGVLRLPIWLRISQRCFIFLRHAYALLLLRKGSLAALCVLSLGDSIERCDLIFPSNRVMPPALSGSNQPWSIKHSKTARTKTWEVLCT